MQTLILLACTNGKDSAPEDTFVPESEPQESTPDSESPPDSQDPIDSDSPPDSDSPDSPVDTGPPPVENIGIAGSWLDNWGSTHDINNISWITGSSRFNITWFDNAQRALVAQNDAINTYNPELWSRFDWTSDGTYYYYCQTAYAAATEADALATPAPDGTNLTTGCGGFSWSQLIPRLEIQGEWQDDWGTTHTISETTWQMTADWGNSLYAVTQYDNGQHYVIAQNDAANTYNPGAWSRFDWAYDGRYYYYCQTAYAAATEADALATPMADNTNLTAGCGGFAWTRLREPLEIAGTYTDSWGTTHIVSETLWDMGVGATFAVSTYDNNGQFIIAHNAADNTWSPDLWSRFDWVWDGPQLYYCQIAYDALTEADALSNISADRTNLAGGCNGFSWTELLP